MGRTSGGSAGGGGGGAMELISSQVLAAPAGPVVFTAIPGTYNHLKFIVLAATAVASNNDILVITFNADLSGDYDSEELNNSSDTAVEFIVSVAAGSISPSGPRIAAADATAHTPGILEIDVPGYAGSTFLKLAKVLGGYVDAQKVSTSTSWESSLGEWRNTAPITSVSFRSANNANFVVGSAFYMYGIT